MNVTTPKATETESEPETWKRVKPLHPRRTWRSVSNAMTMMTSKMGTQTRNPNPKRANANEAHSVCSPLGHSIYISHLKRVDQWIHCYFFLYLHFKLLPASLIDMFISYSEHTKAFVLDTFIFYAHIAMSLHITFIYLFFIKFLNCFSHQVWPRVNPLFNLPAINIILATCPAICWLSDKLRHVIMEAWLDGLAGWWVDYAQRNGSA